MAYSPYAHTTATSGRAGVVRLGSGVGGTADGTLVTTSVPNGVITSGSYSDPSWLTISKSKVGLGNVDNTADANKTVSAASTAGSATGANYQLPTGTASNANTQFSDTPAHRTSWIEANGSSNAPNTGWFFLESMRHSNATNNWGTQYAHGWEDNANRVWKRNISAGSYSAWVEFITSSNIGSQSVNYASTAGSAPASDVYAWAKASTKPSYTNSEVGLGNVGNYTVNQSVGSSDSPTFNIVYANQFLYQSDATLKNNIENITGSWDVLDKLRPVSFDWKNNQKSDYGFIAQELQEVLPNSVGSDGRSLGITPSAIIAHLVAAVKDLKSQVETLTNRLGD